MSSKLNSSHLSEQTPLSQSPSRSYRRGSLQHSPERHGHPPNRLPKRVRTIFFTMGAAVLLSWNVLITATPYFLTRLRDSAFEKTFPSYLSVSFTSLLFLCLAKATVTSNPSSSASRIQHAIVLTISMLLLFAISPLLPIKDGAPFFVFVIINSAIQASSSGYLQSAVVGVAALFGAQAMQVYFTGQSAVGIVVSVVQYVTAAISLRSEEEGEVRAGKPLIGFQLFRESGGGGLTLFAFVFFGLATVYMIVSLIAHSALVRSPLYRSVVLFRDQKDDAETILEVEAPTPDEISDYGSDVDTEDDQAFLSRSVELHRQMSSSQLLYDTSNITWKVAKMNTLYNISVCLIYVVTLAIFPPITSTILSVNHSRSHFFLSPPLFVSLHFVIFNIGDYIGRDIASPTHLSWWNECLNDPKLLLASIGRLIFVPLFLMCNVNGKASSPHPSIPFINSDIAYFIVLLLFSISSGYLVNIVMMSATSVEHNRRLRVLVEEAKLMKGGAGNGTLEVDAAATVAQFCLIGGLFLGSFMSFGVQSIICGGCNPFYG